jgi:hypothetical protein
MVVYRGSVDLCLVDPSCALRTAQTVQCWYFLHIITVFIVIPVVGNSTEHSTSHTQFEARPMSEERKGTPPPADEPAAEAPAVAAAAEAGQPARELLFCCSCLWLAWPLTSGRHVSAESETVTAKAEEKQEKAEVAPAADDQKPADADVEKRDRSKERSRSRSRSR